jgi:predicted DCC family thiol-disulfide oxidoreductase YuxK
LSTPRAVSTPARAIDGKIILFDGVCNLCNGSVRFILKHDGHKIYKFASIQSDAGRQILSASGFPPDYQESILYIEDGRSYTRSTAALRILRNLNAPWPVLYAARAVPAWIRDGIYDWIARNRYAIFGRRDACLVPGDGVASRFL